MNRLLLAGLFVCGSPGVVEAAEPEQALRIVSFQFGDDEKTPSVYVETATGVWKEYYKGDVFAVYKDVGTSGEYVQILDESRGRYIRFYKDRAYHGQSKSERGEFLYKITWTKGSLKGSSK